MIKPNKFYDFTSNYKNSKYVVFGVPFDNTSSFRSGSRWAPDIMRKVCCNFESYDYFHNLDMNDLYVHDAGNIEPFIKIQDTLNEVYLETKSIVEDNKIPIMLGGEHSLTYATVKACNEYYNNNITTIVLDAHLDMKSEYGGIKYSHACVSRHIYEEINNNYIMIGLRSGIKEEWNYIKNNNIQYYTSEDIDNLGMKLIISKILKSIKTDMIYLSIDMDVLDPIYCSGVGTPEPFGLTPLDIKRIINSCSKKIIGLDVVELTPEYDNELSAILSTKFIREYIYSKED